MYAASVMKLFIDIFGVIKIMVELYGSNYAVLINKDVNVTKLTTVSAGLPINET